MPKRHKRILVHCHLYYYNQADMLLSLLGSVKSVALEGYDLFVTMRDRNYEIEQKIKSSFPKASIIIAENVGADVWPFISVLNSVDLGQYGYIIKIHTKRDHESVSCLAGSHYLVKRGDMRRFLLSFMAPKNLKRILSAFEKNPKLGMVGDHRCIIRNFERKSWAKPFTDYTKEFMLKNFSLRGPIDCVSGTMFIARAELFNIFKGMTLSSDNFSQYDCGIDPERNKYLYALEESFGATVIARGYKIEDTYTPVLDKLFHYLKNALRKLEIPIRKLYISLICSVIRGKGRRCAVRDILKNPSYSKPVPFAESALAHQYLDGLNGIEIGGSSQNSFGLERTGGYANIDYDFIQGSKWQSPKFPPKPVNIVSGGDDLPFKDDALDYVISSHVIEHFFDPVFAIKEWLRVVRPGGYVFMIVPDKERTWDRDRPLTALKEFHDRYEGKLQTGDYLVRKDVNIAYNTDLERGIPADCMIIAQKDVCVDDKYRAGTEQDHHHWSVWTYESFLEMIKSFGFEVADSQNPDDKVGTGFTVVLKKARGK